MPSTGGPRRSRRRIRASGTTSPAASAVSAGSSRPRRRVIRAIRLDATQYPTYLLRSELRVQTPGANHIQELEAQLTRPQSDYRARVFLGYALAKELDDVGRFDEAFHSFAAAAKTRRERLSYDVAIDERKLQRVAEVYPRGSAERRARRPGSVDSSRHLFIVGMPRSGTTLVERILGSLPDVRSNGETDNFSRALLAAARGEGDVFQRAAAADPQAVAAGYDRLAGSGGHVIEKLPLNYLYLGAIHRALPEAKLLLVRRSPLDSCFAMYRTLFAAGVSLQLRPRGARPLLRRLPAAREPLARWSWGGAARDRVRGPGARAASASGVTWLNSAASSGTLQRLRSRTTGPCPSRPARRRCAARSTAALRVAGATTAPTSGALVETLRSRGVTVAD